jgi:hypothetical protein
MAKVPGIKCKFSLKTSQAVFEAGALRQVIAEVQDGFVVLRLRGLSTSFAIPWGGAPCITWPQRQTPSGCYARGRQSLGCELEG